MTSASAICFAAAGSALVRRRTTRYCRVGSVCAVYGQYRSCVNELQRYADIIPAGTAALMLLQPHFLLVNAYAQHKLRIDALRNVGCVQRQSILLLCYRCGCLSLPEHLVLSVMQQDIQPVDSSTPCTQCALRPPGVSLAPPASALGTQSPQQQLSGR
jgi:hypothetical protein